MVSGIEAKVCADIEARQMLGINKYGTTVAENPLSLRQWLEHAYQEALDQAIYLRRAMAQIDKEEREKPRVYGDHPISFGLFPSDKERS